MAHCNFSARSFSETFQWFFLRPILIGPFKMVIELSGVQFGLKSCAWFQNQTSAQREFDLKSQVWFQTKIAWHEVQLPLYYTHFEITSMISDQNCMTRSSITTLFYTPILKSHDGFLSIQWNPGLTICQGSDKIISLKRDIVIAEFPI